MRCRIYSIFLMMAIGLAGRAEETVLYRAQWGQGEKGLDGWTVTTLDQAAVDPKAGPSITFGPGNAVSPRLTVQKNHRLRFRYTFRKTLPGMLYVSAKHYAGDRMIGLRELTKFHEPFPDPRSEEVGVLTDPEADRVELAFGLQGDAAQRMTLSAFEVIDCGPPADAAVDGKELLEDPGWEARAPREALPAENSYGIGTWMGWGLPAVMVITRLPDRVHSGKQALMVRPTADTSLGHCGFRSQFTIPVKPDAWYDFSVWAKGDGTIQLYYVNDMALGTVLLSPTEWRQVHLVYCADNPNRKGFSIGILVSGRVFIDDLSVKQITPAQAVELRKAPNPWPAPPKVAQTVPEGEKRPSDNVILENAYLRAVLSPVGGGHVVELEDKTQKEAWTNVSLLNLSFPGQPVPIEWNIPFKATRSADGKEVVFSHTVTGGAAAPFLDGVAIEQTFRLGADDPLLKVNWRLTNTSNAKRLPNSTVRSMWEEKTGIRRLNAEGDEGAMVADSKMISTRNLVAGWMAAASDKASLVWGFDVQAAQEGILDPTKRSVSWSYLSFTLPPGGSWQTAAWVAPVALPEVNYADETAAVQVALKKADKQYDLVLGANPFTSVETGVRACVKDYGNREIAAVDLKRTSTTRFDPPTGRFVTALELTTSSGKREVELFNDPRAREQKDAGIEGAGQTQYRPTVPTRVLRLPEVGDLRPTLAQSKTVLWAKGLFFQYYPLEASLKKSGLDVESVDWANGFVEDVEELSAFRAVILSNLGAVHFSALSRAALSQYVRAGGCLLVLGGSLALGNACSKDTDLEDMLPATLTGPFDVLPVEGRDRVLRPTGAFAKDLTWKQQPLIYWMHRIQPRASAQVLACAGKTPVLLKGNCGLGTVILFSGTVEGEPTRDELACWNWEGWGGLWEAVLKEAGLMSAQ